MCRIFNAPSCCTCSENTVEKVKKIINFVPGIKIQLIIHKIKQRCYPSLSLLSLREEFIVKYIQRDKKFNRGKMEMWIHVPNFCSSGLEFFLKESFLRAITPLFISVRNFFSHTFATNWYSRRAVIISFSTRRTWNARRAAKLDTIDQQFALSRKNLPLLSALPRVTFCRVGKHFRVLCAGVISHSPDGKNIYIKTYNLNIIKRTICIIKYLPLGKKLKN